MVLIFYLFSFVFHVLLICCALPFSFSCVPALWFTIKVFTATKFLERKRCHLYFPSPQIPSLFYFLEAFLCSIRKTPFKIRKLSQILFFFSCFFQIRKKPQINYLLCFVAKPSFYNYALEVSMALA